jgi:hypothetical protein
LFAARDELIVEGRIWLERERAEAPQRKSESERADAENEQHGGPPRRVEYSAQHEPEHQAEGGLRIGEADFHRRCLACGG